MVRVVLLWNERYNMGMEKPKMNPLTLLVAAATRNLATMFPQLVQASPKHNHWFDFGYPVTLTFEHFYTMYKRNGIARAGVARIVEKTWQDNPWLLEREEVHEETKLEQEVADAFDRLQVWGKLRDCDERARVGKYGGVIFRFADNKLLREPVDSVPGGLDGLVELIPFYEGQMVVSEWVTDEKSKDYGQPKMYEFTEASTALGVGANRKFSVHPDRVHVWSRDGSVHGESCLEAGYNHLVDIEKIMGAGGEGFWKIAKAAPVLNIDKDANIQTLQSMLGAADAAQIAEKLDAIVGDWQKGFDQVLAFQAVEAKTLPLTMPVPEHFLAGPLQGFAASIPIPMKILLGSQTGERASTEDANEWNATVMSRRNQHVVPNIKRIVGRLVQYKILADRDWFVDWSDLTEASASEKIDRALKMADMNAKSAGLGERYFTADEVREVMDMEPGSDLALDLPDSPDEQSKPTPIEQAANSRRGRVMYLVHSKAA